MPEDGEGPLVVPPSAAECGGDVGMTVLAVDADGEVAQAGHDVEQVPGPDLRGGFVEGAVSDVVELILDAALVQVGSVIVLGVQGVSGDHRAG